MKKGFTLVELVVSLAILSISMVAITMIFSVALNTRQKNDIKQSTSGHSQSIIENFRAVRYDKLDNNLYKGDMTTGVSTFVYFNNMSNFNTWFQNYINGTTQITGNVDSSAYPSFTGNQFGALIKISKKSITGVTPYHIYVRVWKLAKGAQSQSVREIYISRDPL